MSQMSQHRPGAQNTTDTTAEMLAQLQNHENFDTRCSLWGERCLRSKEVPANGRAKSSAENVERMCTLEHNCHSPVNCKLQTPVQNEVISVYLDTKGPRLHRPELQRQSTVILTLPPGVAQAGGA